MNRALCSIVVIVALSLSLSSSASADISAAAVLFLKIAPGARAAGMGESFVATADDATASYWNPAGLGFYPLNVKWIKHPFQFDPEERIISMALMDNGLPEFNYKQYDIWIATQQEVWRPDGGVWRNYDEYMLEPGQTLEELVETYSGLTDEMKIKERARKVALFNNLSWDEETGLIEKQVGDRLFTYDPSQPGEFSSLPPLRLMLPLSLPLDGEITSLAVAGKQIWVGTNKGLYLYGGLKWSNVSTEEGSPSEKINCMGVDDDGVLWVGTDRGLGRWMGNKWTTFSVVDGLADSSITAIAFGKRKEVWVGTGGGVSTYDGKSWSSVPNHEMLTDKGQFTALALDRFGSLWAGTDFGVLRYDGQKWELYGHRTHIASDGDSPETIAANYVRSKDDYAIQQLADKIVERNDVGNPSFSDSQKVFVPINPAASRVLSITTAGDVIYIGTEEGTIQYDGQRWSEYDRQGLQRKKSTAIIQQHGDLWFATDDEVMVRASTKREFTFMHANWLPGLGINDLYYDFLAYVQHVEGWGTLGGHITFMSYGEQTRTDEYGNEIGTFNSYDLAVTVSYGTQITDNLASGMNIKLIHSHLAEAGAGQERGKGTGTTFAVDGGLIYRPWRSLSLAMALQHLGPDISYIDPAQADPLPRNLKAGFAWQIFNTDYNDFAITYDLNKELVGVDDAFRQELKEIVHNAGMEYWYSTYVALRAGYLYDQEGQIKAPTFGAGLQYSILRFDFGYVAAEEGHPLADQMRFSLTTKF